MSKKLIALLIGLIISITLIGQNQRYRYWAYGLGAGINYSTIDKDGVYFFESGTKFKPDVWVSSDFGLTQRIGISTGLGFSNIGYGDYLDIYCLTMPVLGQLKTGKVFWLEMGPEFILPFYNEHSDGFEKPYENEPGIGAIFQFRLNAFEGFSFQFAYKAGLAPIIKRGGTFFRDTGVLIGVRYLWNQPNKRSYWR